VKTDREKLTELFTELGIGFKIGGEETVNQGAIICKEGRDARVDGYNRFYAQFNFQEDGKFIDMGVGE